MWVFYGSVPHKTPRHNHVSPVKYRVLSTLQLFKAVRTLFQFLNPVLRTWVCIPSLSSLREAHGQQAPCWVFDLGKLHQYL